MASLIEELIITLKQEHELYEKLIPIAEDKTKIIIKNDLESLQKITEKEQSAVEEVNSLEKKREEIVTNVGTVISRDPSTLNIQTIIKLLETQPKEQQELSIIHDNLKKTIHRLMEINNHNKSLIEQSLEMIEFNMNFIQSTRMSPGNNNYTKGAASADYSSNSRGMFDAKQ